MDDQNRIKVFALGGLDENGKNCYVVEINDNIFVFEAGMKYPESLTNGVDMIIPDFSYLIKHKDQVKAYFISHGHDDIMGSLAYVYEDAPAPIYCSNTTRHMILDTAKRFRKDIDFKFNVVNGGDEVDIAGFKTTFFSTTHSISNSLGIAIDSGVGLIVYTGDFIIDYEALRHFRTDLNLVARLGEQKVLLLMTESISADKEGHASPNHKMTPLCYPYFTEHKGRIILSVFSQNLFSVREALDMAIKSNRRICIYDDNLKDTIKSTCVNTGYMTIPTQLVDKEELSLPGHDDVLILVGGIGESVFITLQKIASNEDKYLSIKPTDTIIIASPPVPGIENLATKVVDELYKTGAKVVNMNKKKVISMHARSEDLKLMISLLKPKYYLPVKGEYVNLIANANTAVSMDIGYNHQNILVYDNGMVASFIDGKYKGCCNTMELTDGMVSGLIVADAKSTVLMDRQKLSEEGVLSIGITVDSKLKKIISGTDIQMRGVIFLKNGEELLSELTKTFEDNVQEMLDSDSINDVLLKEKLHDRLVTIVRKHTGKVPMVLPIILDIRK